MSDNFSAQRVLNQQLDGCDARLVDPDRPRCNRCTVTGLWGCTFPGGNTGERCNFCAQKQNAHCNTANVTMRQHFERIGSALPDYAPHRMAVQQQKPPGTGRRFNNQGRRFDVQGSSQVPPPPPPQVAQGHAHLAVPTVVDAVIIGQLQQIAGMLQQQQSAIQPREDARPSPSRRRSRSPREGRRNNQRDRYRGDYREESRSESFRTDYRQRDDYRSAYGGRRRDDYREESRASHRQSDRRAVEYQRNVADYPGRHQEVQRRVSEDRGISDQAFGEHTSPRNNRRHGENDTCLMNNMRQAKTGTARETVIKKEDAADDQTTVSPKIKKEIEDAAESSPAPRMDSRNVPTGPRSHDRRPDYYDNQGHGDGRRYGRPTSLICFACGRPGHRAIDCPDGYGPRGRRDGRH